MTTFQKCLVAIFAIFLAGVLGLGWYSLSSFNRHNGEAMAAPPVPVASEPQQRPISEQQNGETLLPAEKASESVKTESSKKAEKTPKNHCTTECGDVIEEPNFIKTKSLIKTWRTNEYGDLVFIPKKDFVIKYIYARVNSGCIESIYTSPKFIDNPYDGSEMTIVVRKGHQVYIQRSCLNYDNEVISVSDGKYVQELPMD